MTEPVRRCPVCEHPSILGINQAILNGKPFRAIARDFRVGSERSGEFRPDHKKVTRHAEGCLSTSYQKVQEANLSAQGAALQARMAELDAHVDTVLKDALEGEVIMVGDVPLLDEATGHPLTRRNLRLVLAAVREGRQNAEVRAKLAGAVENPDNEGLEASRQALQDPTVRRLVQQMEERMAELETQAGRDQVTT